MCLILALRNLKPKYTTYPDAKTLAKEKLPILRTFGGEEHAGNEQCGRHKHRKFEVTHVE